jgi:hypothetical protein
MHPITKKLAVAATATALIGAIGASVAQTDVDSQTDPMATQQVDVPANASGQQIYFFRDQGNSPETDPAAHLLLIKHRQMVPVAETERTTTTTVAQTTAPMDTTTTVMPGPSDTSNTEASADTTRVASASVDETPTLAPKADRN